jgi:hypothetical protein
MALAYTLECHLYRTSTWCMGMDWVICQSMWKYCDEKVFPILGLGWTCMNSYGSRSNLSFPQGTSSLESIVPTSVWRALILIPCLETLSCMSSALPGPSPSVSDLVQLLTYRPVR